MPMPARGKIAKSKVGKKNKMTKQLNSDFKSFHISKSSDKFITFKVTKQTFYWLILLIYILILNVLIVNSQIKAALAIG